MEDRLLICTLEYLCVKLFCIGRRGGGWPSTSGGGWPSTSYNRQINTSLGMVVDIYITWNFGGSDLTPNHVDYDEI